MSEAAPSNRVRIGAHHVVYVDGLVVEHAAEADTELGWVAVKTVSGTIDDEPHYEQDLRGRAVTRRLTGRVEVLDTRSGRVIR